MKYLFTTILILFFYNTALSQISIDEIHKERYFDSLSVNNLIKEKDSWANYKLSQYLDMNNNLFEATGDIAYLNESLRIILEVISNSKISKNYNNSQYKDTYYGWVNKSHPQLRNDGKEYSLYDSYFWRYATNTLLIIKNNSLIIRYRTNFYRIKEFAETNVFKKWFSRGENNIYRHATNLFAQWAHISLNLWLIEPNAEYHNVYTGFNTFFYDSLLREKNGKLFWYSVRGNDLSQDVSHANSEVSYFIHAYENGVPLKDELILDMIKILKTQIIKSNLKTSYYLDGSGSLSNDNRYLIDGFLKLGRFDNSLNEILMSIPQMPFSTEYFRKSHAISVLMLNKSKLSR